ncbi:MAG: Omp28-related outer membrane protein [candidate division WOR-3 bacterium]|nr:MAG: Omp28-related outer membrane protein [candidate division WOR-3 bacterium]
MDQIVINNPGRVAAIEWHISGSYPLYNAEGRGKMYRYPPPYNGGYATPWAWIDGKQRGYQYYNWSGYVSQQLEVPADVGVNLSGSYDPTSRQGEVTAEFVNETGSPLQAVAFAAITEDSLYYQGPNGDPWHNHVCRDYLPDQYGTTVDLSATGSDTVVLPYDIRYDWNPEKCRIVVYLQNMTMQPDSSLPVYQGAETPVMDLVGVEEQEPERQRIFGFGLSVSPNPVTEIGFFRFQAPVGSRYALDVFAADGRLVRSLSGDVTGADMSAAWDRRDDAGQRVARGIYAYRLRAGAGTSSGKLVVAD